MNMTQDTQYDNKIRVTKTHAQATGSIEFCIPKELCIRYDLTEPTNIMLIPRENDFIVRKLVIEYPKDLEEKEKEKLGSK